MSLPEYKPRRPISTSTTQSYDAAVKAYGPAPTGYRWLKLGEEIQKDDIYANYMEWRTASSCGDGVSNYSYPYARKAIATELPASPIFSPKPAATPKVSTDLQKLLEETRWLEESLVNVNKRLAEIKKAIRGLT